MTGMDAGEQFVSDMDAVLEILEEQAAAEEEEGDDEDADEDDDAAEGDEAEEEVTAEDLIQIVENLMIQSQLEYAE